MSSPKFQVFQCKNSQCRLRFPSNLSITIIERCPLCGNPLQVVGSEYSNYSRINDQKIIQTKKVSLLLDNLRSTLNVGSIFRTADGVGISHIYCCGTTPTPEHPKIKKTGLGAEDFTTWSYHRNALDLLDSIGTDSQLFSLESTKESQSLFDLQKGSINSKSKILLVLGNEISGIDPAILERSDRVLELPMLGRKTSINVAVAAGIAMYKLLETFIFDEEIVNQ